MKKIITLAIIIALLLSFKCIAQGQNLLGTISGTVTDQNSNEPIPFATVKVMEVSPIIGTQTDIDGQFLLENVPLGRHHLEVSYVGYETIIINDVLVNSINNQAVTIRLKEITYELSEVVVRPKQEKEKPLNRMATISAKQLNMDEANRIAGAFDDPARLVTTFAGVASNAGDNNAFSVRGNSPKGTLWQIEGIPVPNPNHFGEINGFGGGGITALSTKTIGNSDFFMGAFPAEYGNALSSVFDLSIRKGNSDERHHSIQVGFFGLDVASEGPFSKNSEASYLVNYRYSTLGLIGLGLDYQDLSFKLNFPTKKAGTFSVWGLGLVDALNNTPDPDTINVEEPLDEEVKWQYYDDITTEDLRIATGMVGLTHKLILNKNSYLKTTLSGAINQLNSENSRLDSTFMTDYPLDKIDYKTIDYRFSSNLNTKFSPTHTNRTGILLTNSNYEFDLNAAPSFGDPLVSFAKDQGSNNLLQAYTQSSFELGKLRINPGVHLLYSTFNEEYSIEPRLGLDYAVNSNITLALGYGLHSQLEKLSFYLSEIPTESGTEQLNRTLGLGKAHHFVLAYDQIFGKYTHLRIEPYYQSLFNIPIIENSHFSMLNLNDDFFINEQLVNEGTGRNYGIDITLERFQNKGFYYSTTLSLFRSEYTDGNGIVRPTRFNREVVGNFTIGKEWLLKKKNLLSTNLRYTYLGGNWTHPIDEATSLKAKEIIEDYSEAFTIQNPTSHVVSFTITYRVNREKISSLWSLQMLNLTGAKEYLGYQYNFRNNSIEENTDTIVLPNLSYRLEF
ncbi:MAG: TonB-dependent receptor [Bacteroidota bacterium]